ncbi:DUF6114 domain-containing protein [Dictyobacter kobayashii]|uniref:Uncharacterized protein n=1 Tax=Dictyobacter kobayashii TaxID=2014872 RepID=A0A402AIU2_9CHLR|nr:DUF6114 domain-containing protein [Dictyobacter kobayashii]GCE19051.1 hypothetical protein KDK_28510 [Dictyobacter kobayashii]
MATSTRRINNQAVKRETQPQAEVAVPESDVVKTVEVAGPAEAIVVEPAVQPVIESPFRFRLNLWQRQRPVVGSLMIVTAGILVLWGPLALMQFAFLPGNTIWAGLLVGTVLCVLGLLQLFFPGYALVTGILAIVCALASLMAAAGGFGIGMILGIIGGAQGVAWCSVTMTRAEYQHMLDQQSRRPRKKRWPGLRKRQADSQL